MGESSQVAVIGGGFSGTILIGQLVRQATQPFDIILIDKSQQLSKGTAYGTTDPYHLLNVRARNMSAFPHDHDHFFRWILEHEQRWRPIDPTFQDLPLSLDQFYPRKIYGAYLEFIWQETVNLSREKGIEIKVYREEAVDLQAKSSEKIDVCLSSGRQIQAHFVALCVGVPTSKQFLETSHPHYIAEAWSEEARRFLSPVKLQALSENTLITIMGSGLTTIDVLVSLLMRNYQGKVLILSKQGKWPEIQYPPLTTPLVHNWHSPPTTAYGWLKRIREEVRKAASQGQDWRSVVDSLRPVTISLWKNLAWEERRKIVQRLFGIWNRHRHRMPPNYTALIMHALQSGKVRLEKGDVRSVEGVNCKKLEICYTFPNNIDEKRVQTDYLINCTGPELNIMRQSSRLMQNLLRKKIVLPDPLKLGIRLTLEGEVQGSTQGKLFAIGQILFGELFETVAVPELRTQCSQLAGLLLQRLFPGKEHAN